MSKYSLVAFDDDGRYVDVDMSHWQSQETLLGMCIHCRKIITEAAGFARCGTDDVLHLDCVRVYHPSELLSHVESYHKIQHLYSRFGEVLDDADAEFQFHMPEKGDSWKTCEIRQLFNPFITVLAKAVVASDGDDDLAFYDEMIDLLNMCLMVAERFRRDKLW